MNTLPKTISPNISSCSKQNPQNVEKPMPDPNYSEEHPHKTPKTDAMATVFSQIPKSALDPAVAT